MEVNLKLTEKARRDYQLVRAALERGEQMAYSELVKNYRDSLYFLMLKMTNNPQDADDLTIEAFGKAFRNLNQYTPDFAFSTWLFKIASNNCIDFLRRKKMNDAVSLDNGIVEEGIDDLANMLHSTSRTPEEDFIRKQKINTLRNVVERLKPHYRRLIELRYYEELSYEEISKQLDLPVGTIKAQLFRAREFLYNILVNTPERLHED